MQVTTSQANGVFKTGSLERGRLIDEALDLSTSVLSYRVGRFLSERFADKALIESGDSDFDVEGYARAGHCALTPRPEVYAELLTSWNGYHEQIFQSWAQGWYNLEWQGQHFELLSIEWPSGYCKIR